MSRKKIYSCKVPLKFAFRFSRNATVPSFASELDRQMAKASISILQPVLRSASIPLLMACFAERSEALPFDAMVSAVFMTSAMSWSWEQTVLTSPTAWASAAEIIFRQQAAEAGRADEFQIDSAGTIGFHQGSPPDSRMSDALVRHGFTVSGCSRQIDACDLETFDLIVTMDESNLDAVRDLDADGAFHGKIRPFVSYCRNFDDPRVPDPYYGGQRGFDHVIALIKDGCQGILDEIGRG